MSIPLIKGQSVKIKVFESEYSNTKEGINVPIA